MTSALEIDGVSVRFGGLLALDRVSFAVSPGEFLAVIGPNGAGKTTLFNTIAGVIRPTAGTVRLRGKPVEGSRPAHMSHLGVRRTFQVARPFASLSVRENVRLAAPGPEILHGVRSLGLRGRSRELSRRTDELLALTGLTGLAERRAGELNIGALRRLEIARALSGEPAVLLLDEPAAGIGVDGLQPLAELIREVHRRGLTVLLVEHYVGLALALADRVIVLDEGRLIAEGPPDTVRQDERVITAYLGRRGRQATFGLDGGAPGAGRHTTPVAPPPDGTAAGGPHG